MSGYDFKDNLVEVSKFSSPTDAARIQAYLEIEGVNASIEGTSLLVRQGDLRRAREVLADLLDGEDRQDEEVDDYDSDYDADDWSGEDWADDDDDLYEEYDEEPAETPPVVRAWRAAVIGFVLMAFWLPFLVINGYSMWVIYEHRLWEPSERTSHWRFYGALVFNLFGILFFWATIRWRGI